MRQVILIFVASCFGLTSQMMATESGIFDLLETGQFDRFDRLRKHFDEKGDPRYLNALKLFYQSRYVESGSALQDAVRTVQKGSWQQPNDRVAELGQRLAILSPVAKTFQVLKSKYFHFYYASDDERYMAQIAQIEMDAIFERLRAALGVPENLIKAPIRVEFWPNINTFSAATGVPVIALNGSGTVAICKYNRLMMSSPKLYVRGYQFIATLAHELVHYLLIRLSANRCPLWLHEGIAKFFEVLWQDTVPGRISDAQKSMLAEALSRKEGLVPIAKMSPSFAYLTGNDGAIAFAQVSTMVNRMVVGGQQRFHRLLKSLQSGQQFGDLFATHYQQSFADFQAAWKVWLEQQNFQKLDQIPDQTPRLAQSFSQVAKTGSTEITVNAKSESQKYHLVANLLFDRHHYDAALLEFEKAWQRKPDDYRILRKLGLLYHRKGAFEKGIKRLQPGHKNFPEDDYMTFLLGILKRDHGQVTEAITLLRHAVFANPFDQAYLEALALTYGDQPRYKNDLTRIEAHLMQVTNKKTGGPTHE